MSQVTAHVVVRNEEIWIWYTIMAIIDHVDKILVCDTGSEDNTISIIESIKSDKIELIKKPKLSNEEFSGKFTVWKNELIALTKTPWWIVVDGDEIYSTSAFKQIVSKLDEVPEQYTTTATRMKYFVEHMHRVSAEAVTWRYAFVRTNAHWWILDYGDEVLGPRPERHQRLANWYAVDGWEFDCFHTSLLKRSHFHDGPEFSYQRKHRQLRSEVGKLYNGMYGYSGPYPEIFYSKDVPEIVKNPYIEQIFKTKEEFGM